jgi:hypothetical protein
MSFRGTGSRRKLIELPSLSVPPSPGRRGTRPWTDCGAVSCGSSTRALSRSARIPPVLKYSKMPEGPPRYLPWARRYVSVYGAGRCLPPLARGCSSPDPHGGLAMAAIYVGGAIDVPLPARHHVGTKLVQGSVPRASTRCDRSWSHPSESVAEFRSPWLEGFEPLGSRHAQQLRGSPAHVRRGHQVRTLARGVRLGIRHMSVESHPQ